MTAGTPQPRDQQTALGSSMCSSLLNTHTLWQRTLTDGLMPSINTDSSKSRLTTVRETTIWCYQSLDNVPSNDPQGDAPSITIIAYAPFTHQWPDTRACRAYISHANAHRSTAPPATDSRPLATCIDGPGKPHSYNKDLWCVSLLAFSLSRYPHLICSHRRCSASIRALCHPLLIPLRLARCCTSLRYSLPWQLALLRRAQNMVSNYKLSPSDRLTNIVSRPNARSSVRSDHYLRSHSTNSIAHSDRQRHGGKPLRAQRLLRRKRADRMDHRVQRDQTLYYHTLEYHNSRESLSSAKCLPPSH